MHLRRIWLCARSLTGYSHETVLLISAFLHLAVADF
jgi:hypothetical protein